MYSSSLFKGEKMQVTFDIIKNISFKGKREDRNKIAQLKESNDYALNFNNQLAIRNSIENISKDSDEKDIHFLMDVAQNLQYGFGVDINKNPNNNWKIILKNATKSSIDKISDEEKKASFEKEYSRIFLEKRDIKPEEQEILDIRNSILKSKVLNQALRTTGNENIINIPKNLDYFIVSSEVSLKEKKECLNKLNFFLTPAYKIDTQLKDRKAEVLGEILNDIIIKRDDDEKATIKQVNQQHHGMCAAISICRKALAYEDKSKYIDIILSELDNNDQMEVFDVTKLGSGEKVKIDKASIDFDAAIDSAYRIIDASALNWMNAAGMTGSGNKVVSRFVAFDSINNGTFDDSFFSKDSNEPDVQTKHDYLRSLIKATRAIEDVKAKEIKSKVLSNEQTTSKNSNVEFITKVNAKLAAELTELMPEKSNQQIREVHNELLKLGKKTKNPTKYNFFDVEENSMKMVKIANFLKSKSSNIDPKMMTEKIENIFDLTDASATTREEMFKHHRARSAEEIARENGAIFKAGAAVNTMMQIRLNDKDEINKMLVKYDLKDMESRLIDNIDEIVNQVSNPQEQIFTNVIQSRTGMTSKQEVIELLTQVKEQVSGILEINHSIIYDKLSLGRKQDVLIPYIDEFTKEIKSGNTESLKEIAQSLKMKPEKRSVLKELSLIKSELSSNETISEKKYVEYFNKLGFKSQSKLLAETFNVLQELVSDENCSEEIIEAIAKKNNVEATPQRMRKIFTEFANEINNSTKFLQNVESLLEIKDQDENYFNTIDSKELILNKMMKDGSIYDEEGLYDLGQKFMEIARFDDEKEKAQIKGITLKNNEVYKFTPAQKELLNKIKGDINELYSNTSREYKRMYRVLEEPLNEIKHEVGREDGQFWVTEEGSSGLHTSQQIRIFEQMTGRRYGAEYDLEKIAEKIKNGTHSGISATSVMHDDIGAHAQYIAGIMPIKHVDPKTGEMIVEDALMQDNSWGDSEHLQRWTDSMGVQRTDYDRKRGGVNGYITNPLSQNGVFINDFLYTGGKIEKKEINNKIYNRIKPDRDLEKFNLFFDAVIPSSAKKETRSASVSILEAIFKSAPMLIGDLQNLPCLAAEMSDEQLESAFKRVEGAEVLADKTSRDILRRIEGTQYEKGIASLEGYNSLDKSDPIRIYTRKLALIDAYNSAQLKQNIENSETQDDLDKVEATLVTTAKDDFKYVFAKNKDVLRYAKNANADKIFDLIKEKSIKMDDKFDKSKLKKAFDMPFVQSDGKLSSTIKLLSNNIIDVISKNVTGGDFNAIKPELSADIVGLLKESMEFNLSDMKDESQTFSNVKKWIDNKFNPTSDEEFVEIYRNLQEMTKKEFNKTISDISNRDLGIKQTSEFDYIRKIRASNEKIAGRLESFIMQDAMNSQMELSDTEPLYNYEKLGKKHTYSVYNKGKNFDDTYRGLWITCENLTIDKYAKSHKDEVFRKYQSKPAFPNIKMYTAENVKNTIDALAEMVVENINFIEGIELQKVSYVQMEKAKGVLKFPKKLNEIQQKEIQNLFEEIVEKHKGDVNMQGAVLLASEALLVEDKTNLNSYTPFLEKFIGEVGVYRNANSDSVLSEAKQSKLDELKYTKKLFLKTSIQPKHRTKVGEIYEEWVSAEIKRSPKADELKVKLINAFDKYHLLKNPIDLVKEITRTARINDKKFKLDVFTSYETYIENMLVADTLSNLEFSLMHATRKGISPKIKDELKTFKIPKPHEKAGIQIGSKEGMSILINTVKDFSNKNETIYLFLNQLGLNEEALNSEIENTNFIKIKEKNAELCNKFVDVKKSNRVTGDAIVKISPMFRNSSITTDEIITKLNETIETNSKKAKISDTAVIDLHKQVFEMYLKYMNKHPKLDRSLLFNEFMNQTAKEGSMKYVQDLKEKIEESPDSLKRQMNFLNNLEFSEGSENDKKRAIFINKIQKCNAEMSAQTIKMLS